MQTTARHTYCPCWQSNSKIQYNCLHYNFFLPLSHHAALGRAVKWLSSSQKQQNKPVDVFVLLLAHSVLWHKKEFNQRLSLTKSLTFQFYQASQFLFNEVLIAQVVLHHTCVLDQCQSFNFLHSVSVICVQLHFFSLQLNFSSTPCFFCRIN